MEKMGEYSHNKIVLKNLPEPTENDVSVRKLDGTVQMCCEIFVYI